MTAPNVADALTVALAALATFLERAAIPRVPGTHYVGAKAGLTPEVGEMAGLLAQQLHDNGGKLELRFGPPSGPWVVLTAELVDQPPWEAPTETA